VVFGLAILPSITSCSLYGSNLILSATRGLAGHTYTVLMSTNAASPISQWTPVAANVLTSGGNFVITATNAVDPASPQRFYALQVQ
jgi:hypothetical protein